MKVGTKSLLFGTHQLLLHPIFVFFAWTNLYGFPRDPRLWVSFVVHDWGYWGCENMDGAEGEKHPELGARILHYLFDHGGFRDLFLVTFRRVKVIWDRAGNPIRVTGKTIVPLSKSTEWYRFGKFHSRFLAKQSHHPVSRLCYADKLAIIIPPKWLYLLLAKASGELYEYMRHAESGKYQHEMREGKDISKWYDEMKEYLIRWIEEHKDGKEDTWTKI